MQQKPVREQVIVITGASSGVGRATAEMAARQGARVVLAARSEDALRDIVDGITAAGGVASYVVTDVSNEDEVKRLSQEAIATYGSYDTWVNNAGVSIYGRLEEVTTADSRQLFETNFWGTVYGSLAAAEHLKTYGGTIVNVGKYLVRTGDFDAGDVLGLQTRRQRLYRGVANGVGTGGRARLGRARQTRRLGHAVSPTRQKLHGQRGQPARARLSPGLSRRDHPPLRHAPAA